MGTFSNMLKTVALLGVLTGLLLWVGNMLAGPTGLAIGLLIAFVMNFVSYFFSDKIALAMYRAQPVTNKNDPLYKMIRELSDKAGLPMPRVFTIASPHPNAFATGRDPDHAAVAVTDGIREILTPEELRGVLAHELSHVKNRDILIASIAAMIAGVISYLAHMAQFAAMFGGGRGDNDRGSGIGLLFLAIVTPIIAMIIQLAISRAREYQADESGAHLIHDSKPLASALEKIEAGVKRNPLRLTAATESTAHLFISSPFRAQGFVHMFMTHPPTKNRVERLKGMKF